MAKWTSLGILVVFVTGGLAAGQNRDIQEPGATADQAPSLQRAPTPPDQQGMPQDSRLEPRAPERASGGQAITPQDPGRQGAVPPNAVPPQPPPPPPPPFVLTAAEQTQLDSLLLFWQQSSQNVKTFRCKFNRWEYDPVFGPPNAPLYRDEGELYYKSPDKGHYSVDAARTEKWTPGGQGQGQWTPTEGRAEKWICDGKSIFEYDFQRKRVVEHRLPPHMQGKAVADGPVPFLFGAKADQLNRRYWMKIVTPPDVQGQIWLDAYPKTAADAQNFKHVELILSVNQNEVQPTAVQINHPNGKNRTAYQFHHIGVNQPGLGIFNDPFTARVPIGWQKLVEDAPQMPGPAQGPGSRGVAPTLGDRRTDAPR